MFQMHSSRGKRTKEKRGEEDQCGGVLGVCHA